MQEILISGKIVRQVKEYPNYGVTSCGDVYRISTRRKMTQYLRGVPEYYSVRVCHNNVAKNARVHVMVALAWVNNPSKENYNIVNHLDGDKLNNNYTNLEWATLSTNQQHARYTLEGNKGEGIYNSSCDDQTVHDICNMLQTGARVIDIHKEFDVSKSVIRNIKAGASHFHIRNLYNIPHTYKNEYSTETVIWICDQIVLGVSDQAIVNNSSNRYLNTVDVKRIRHKIRYKHITDAYF